MCVLSAYQVYVLYTGIYFKEPIHLRNKELLILKAQLQKKVDELLKELENKKAKGKLTSQNSPPRISSPINVWNTTSHWLILTYQHLIKSPGTGRFSAIQSDHKHLGPISLVGMKEDSDKRINSLWSFWTKIVQYFVYHLYAN